MADYDSIADGYAKLRDSFHAEKKYLDLFASYLKPASHILEIGSGSGYPITSYLNDLGFKITGIDASIKLIEIAQDRLPNVEFLYGDIRTIELTKKYDAIIEWWCLFHLPKIDHAIMITRFADWLKDGGVLEFTSGDSEYEGKDSKMLDKELSFYSLNKKDYEKLLIENNFEILLCENDQEGHLVWIARYKPKVSF